MSLSEYKTGEECVGALRGLNNDASFICQNASLYVYELERRIKELEEDNELLRQCGADSDKYIKQLEEVVRQLKALPDDDPHDDCLCRVLDMADEITLPEEMG